MRGSPAHAGRLRPWERSVFGLVFAVMLVFVVAVTMSTARSAGGSQVVAGSSASMPALKAGAAGPTPRPAATGSVAQNSSGAVPETIAPSAQLNRRLAAAVTLAVKRVAGPQAASRLAVGVIDETAGTEAVLRGGRGFAAGGLAYAGLVAALLLQRQRAGQQVGGAESAQAAAMIQRHSHAAAVAIWKRLRTGLPAANATLKLRHTSGPRLSKLKTTVADQLQLLTDLSSVQSPLAQASRSYLLGLMTGVVSGQRWGVPAVADRTGYAVTNGWLPTARGWVVNSAGIVDDNGQELMIVVLSAGSPSKASGVAMVRAAALAAARAITGRP